MNKSTQRLQQLCVMALLCALALAAVATVRIPAILFLKYEPKDVFLTIGGLLYGPIAGGIMCIVTATAELAISDTGLIGLVMNIFSSCLFVCVSSAIYCRKKTLGRAVLGLVCGVAAMTSGMMLWNYLISPLYMGITRGEIVGLLVPVFLPYNLLKSSLNAALTFLLYKGVSAALRSAHLLPQAPAAGHTEGKKHSQVWLLALAAVVALSIVLYFVGTN